ncbi:hypothetical protein ACFSTC_26160 [Nonomuraea ferruginea]
MLVHTGDGTVWVGQLRAGERGAVTLPAASVLGGRLDGVRERAGFSEITYDRGDGVGVVGFDFYEGGDVGGSVLGGWWRRCGMRRSRIRGCWWCGVVRCSPGVCIWR